METKQNIDWEQRRYEITKDVLPSVIAAVDKEHATLNIFDADANHDDPDYEYFENTVEYAVAFADELIKQLKKTTNND